MKWCREWPTLVVWACFSPIFHTPTSGFFTDEAASRSQESGDVVAALNKIVLALDSHERHTALYERVSTLEETLRKKTESESKLESEVLDLRAKIPALEAEIQTIPEMRKDLSEFEAKIEKLVHDYEAKLSALASEVIRLKKYGAKRKDLQTLSDGSDNVLLRIDAPVCPEVGLGMAAERVGDQCLYFSWGTALNWTDAHRHCQSMGGDISAPEDLLPLKTFLHGAFARAPSIWLGASYKIDDEGNITHSTIGEEVISSSVTPHDGDGAVSGDGEHDQTFSFSLNFLGTPDLSKNSIDDEVRDKDSQDDDPSNIFLSDAAVPRDEAASSSGEVLGDTRSLSRRFLNRVGLLASMTSEELNSRLQSMSNKPVVDVVLLKDDDTKVGDDEEAEGRHPSRLLSAERGPELASKPRTLTDGSSLEAINGSISPGVSRDVREVAEESEGRTDSGTSVAQDEEVKTSGKAKMNCMLLQQKESLEYELVGKPCSEQHRFVCEILAAKNAELKFSPDKMLHE